MVMRLYIHGGDYYTVKGLSIMKVYTVRDFIVTVGPKNS